MDLHRALRILGHYGHCVTRASEPKAPEADRGQLRIDAASEQAIYVAADGTVVRVRLRGSPEGFDGLRRALGSPLAPASPDRTSAFANVWGLLW